jgi:hypothetical protein
MILRQCITAVLCAGVLLSPATGEALLLEERNDASTGYKRVLLLRDCQRGLERCLDWQEYFADGDSVRVRAALSRARRAEEPFSEVWLNSGGGLVDEGIAVGDVLREFQATVVVPAGARCASSCTLAFMGGLFRTVHPDGRFLVHAPSIFSGGTHEEDRTVWADPLPVLRFWARSLFEDEPQSTLRLLRYFQRSLTRSSSVSSTRAHLGLWAPLAVPPEVDAQLKVDAVRVKAEGEATAQEVLMRLERQAAELMLAKLRPVQEDLGPRARAALDLIENMYTSRITMTAALSQETLLAMGYVTRFR